MRINHLTFGQLYKLQSEQTLMRVTCAYHKFLRRRWEAFSFLAGCAQEPFSVSVAEGWLAGYAAPWIRVLRFLGSSQLREAVRHAADEQQVPYMPGWDTEIVRIPVAGRGEAATFFLARLSKTFCRINGIPARLSERFFGTAQHCVVVRGATNEFGAKILLYKSGIPLFAIRIASREACVPLNVNFGWLPPEISEAARINPLSWPTHTPNWYNIGKELVS